MSINEFCEIVKCVSHNLDAAAAVIRYATTCDLANRAKEQATAKGLVRDAEVSIEAASAVAISLGEFHLINEASLRARALFAEVDNDTSVYSYANQPYNVSIKDVLIEVGSNQTLMHLYILD